MLAMERIDQLKNLDRDELEDAAGAYLGVLERIRTIVQKSFLNGPSAYVRVKEIREIFDEMEREG
jgi:hypothetical protein